LKTTGKLILFVLTCLALAASAYAQTPREELQQMVEQLQKTPDDNALREKIIKLAAGIKPAPAIPEEAREPFVMGATVLKRASDPAGAGKAVDLFTQALNIAPWFADAYYNRAIAREAAGQFEPAMDDLKLYLEFKLTDAERREAQDKIYALKADAQLASARKAEQDKIARAENAKRQAQQAKRDVITQIKNAVGNRNYNSAVLSYSDDSRRMYDGVNQYELFGGGKYYLWGSWKYYIYFWKFFDERVEVWAPGNGSPFCLVSGESGGPKVTDMRWFNGCSDTQWWGYFDLQDGSLYTGVGGGNNRPISDSEFDSNRRYTYTRYSPPK
jgi:tetratricopeptide (TPR) repeat protein